jgi:hypothetical protein
LRFLSTHPSPPTPLPQGERGGKDQNEIREDKGFPEP